MALLVPDGLAPELLAFFRDLKSLTLKHGENVQLRPYIASVLFEYAVAQLDEADVLTRRAHTTPVTPRRSDDRSVS